MTVSRGPLRVLVVDDSADTCESYLALLRLWGFDARAAADGNAALEAEEGYRPDVLILDVGLPGMDGLEVARRVRARRGVGSPLVVGVSGWGDDRARREAARDCDAYLIKPVEPDEIHALLQKVVAGGAPGSHALG